MALTIDQLEIQIVAEATSATNTLDGLIGRLKTLQSRLNNLGTAGKNAGKGLQETAKGAEKASSGIDKQNKSTEKASKSTKSFTDKLAQQISKTRTLYGAFKTAAGIMAGWFNESNDYIETVNLFNVTMGDAAPAAREYAEAVQNAIGIDSKDFMQYQGVFKNLTAGFGVAAEDANKMSQNLTQLSYDMASFFNATGGVEESFDKLSSAMSGQVKGLREYGIDTTVATLQEYALSKGIDKKVRSMTQAEKALLRYNYIMEQSQHIQGDMARTIITPANALRVLEAQLTRMKRAFGNIVSVIVTQVIPYVQVFVEIITEAANSLAKFFGFSAKDFEADTSGIETSWNDAEESVDDYSESLKKAKKQMMGFDELNIISNPDSDSGSGSDGSSGGSMDMPIYEYDFLKNLDTGKLDEVREKVKDILSWVEAIALGFASWGIAKSLISALEFISKLKAKSFNFGFNIVGGIAFLADLDKIRKYIEDINTNGANFSNVAGVISEFAGLVGDALIMLGNIKFGAALKAVQGVGEIISSIADMTQNGVNWDNATNLVRGLSNLGIAFGLFTKNTTLVGVSLAIQGLTAVVNELATNWEAIKKGDWSGVDKVTLIIGAIEILGGVVTALGLFSKLKGATDIASVTTGTQEIETATQTINTSTSNITSKLKGLVKNLALGIVIIAEIAVAAGLIIAAIWGMGLLLEQVGIAWQPVIDNAGTVAIAMGIGTGLLVVIGAATAGLGAIGTPLIGYLALGIAVLALMGASTLLFIAEIWAIGKGLEQVGIAWQPVIDNGATIKTGIKTGSALLLGIGVVTAALGALTVASAGALPIAIGLGTAMLVALAGAFVKFVNSLVKVANQLSNNLHPALVNLNGKLPSLSISMKNFTTYMKEFAGLVVSYTKSSAISGFAATVDAIVGFFTKDPIKAMADDANKQYKQALGLTEKLRLANPELKTAISLMKNYYKFLEEIETLTGKTNNISLASGMFTSMKEVGKNLVLGFVDGIKSKNNDLSKAVKSVLGNTFTSRLANSYGYDFGRSLANSIASGFKSVSFPTLKGSIDIAGGNADVSLKLRAYAMGGTPDMGEVFIARERGPELVGSIGRKTAVANNDQIISGIESGVYRAMVAANANGNSGSNQTIRIINEIDGDVVGERVIKYHNNRVMQTGASPLLV